MTDKTAPTGAQPEILIVEDSPVEAEMLRRVLARAGYRVTVTKNGEEGLQALREHPCTLVMSDINMPVMNGYDLCHAIKLDEKLWSTPVILVTSLSEPKDIIRALDVGADGYVTKPYVEDILLGRIRSLLANPARRKLAEERRKIQVEYGGEKHNIAVDSPQMVNLLLSVYENSLILNQELMRIQNQLNVLNESLEEKVRERTAALQGSEARFRNLIETTSDWIWEVDENAVYTYASPKIYGILGYEAAEIIGKTPFDLMPPEEAKRVADIFGTIQAARKPFTNLENTNLHKDGRPVVLETNGVPVIDLEGKFRGYRGIDRDITERKQAEAALIHSRDLMRYVIEHNQSGVAVHDRDLKYLYVSQRYLQEYKVKDRDVIGKHHYDVFPDLPQKWRDVHQRVLAGEILSGEDDPYVREDGTVDWTRWECRPWYEADGSVGGIIVYTEIINERKEAEARLAEQLNELRRWHDATLGREMRVVELKREVNELLGQAGQPPRYPSAASDGTTS